MDEGVSKVGQDYARLRELAEKATPGPWDEVHNMAGPMMVKGGKGRRYICHLAINSDEHANAAFIAAANPATFLQLLADNERMREALTDVLNTSGARREYHAMKYADAVEKAEAALNSIQTTGDHHAR